MATAPRLDGYSSLLAKLANAASTLDRELHAARASGRVQADTDFELPVGLVGDVHDLTVRINAASEDLNAPQLAL